MTSLLKEGTYISADVGRSFGCPGLVDFYIDTKKQWLVEIVREGSNFKEHSDRLQPNGKYSLIPRNDEKIVDFRSTTPDLDNLHPSAWYVCERKLS